MPLVNGLEVCTNIHTANETASAITQNGPLSSCHTLKLMLTLLKKLKFCASLWTREEINEIQIIARETVPGIMTMALPQGL